MSSLQSSKEHGGHQRACPLMPALNSTPNKLLDVHFKLASLNRLVQGLRTPLRVGPSFLVYHLPLHLQDASSGTSEWNALREVA